MNQKFLTLFLILIATQVFSQSDISGFIGNESKSKDKVIVNLIQVNEETSNTKESIQVIATTSTNNLGYFHFFKRLPYKSKFYYLKLEGKEKTIRSKNFLLGNEDSIFFEKSTPPLSIYRNSSFSDKEWKKLQKFENNIKKKKKYLDEIRAYSKDSLQILAVKLIGIKELEKKQLLDKDIAVNKEYYSALLKELKESDINPVEYLFFELKLAKFKILTIEESYTVSRSLNFIFGFLILGILFYIYQFKGSKQTLTVLSNQELAIKNLILEKKSNKEIATTLFISVSTVKTHITNLYKKLEVTNRIDLFNKFKNSTGTST